jgi:hypothetical protein
MGARLRAIPADQVDALAARDDVLASHDASKVAAERIPGARFLSLESGGPPSRSSQDHP